MLVYIPIFGMSKSDNPESKQTVIDEYGVDTGLTQQELENFIEEYYNCIEDLGLLVHTKKGTQQIKKESSQNRKIDLERINTFDSQCWKWKSLDRSLIEKESFLKNKINLNRINSFDSLGWKWKSFDLSLDEQKLQTIIHNSLFNRIILVGHTTDSVRYSDNVVDQSTYEFKIEKILKGKSLIPPSHKVGSVVYLHSGQGKALRLEGGEGGEVPYHSNTSYILFLHQYSKPKWPLEAYFYYKFFIPCLVYSNDSVWTDRDYEYCINKPDSLEIFKLQQTYSEIIELLNKVIEINDSKNFYNRSYR
jgi:hypothetical protein